MINKNPTYYKREKLSDTRTAFMFDTLTDYKRFITEVESVATGNAKTGFNRINNPSYVKSAASESWYGTNDPSLVTNDISEFLYNDELDKFLESLKTSNINLDVIDLDQQKSIKFTDQEIGIFSFDLASLGLIPVYEFYSYVLKKIVSGDLVRSKKTANGDIVFYHVYQPKIKRHEVEYSGKFNGYYSEILNRVVDISETIEEDTKIIFPERAEITEHDVERRQVLNENGTKKFATTWKKSFVYIPKIEKPLPRVDIIITASFSSAVNASKEMIYSSMAAIALAEKLAKSSVNYRILAAYATRTSNRPNKDVFAFTKLQDEGEPLDKNKMAMLLSDGRMLRYLGFKGDLATQYDAGYDSLIDPIGIGGAINDAKTIKDAYIDYLKLQTNPADIEAAKNPDSKLVFAGSLSQKDAQDQYNKIVEQISRVV